MSINSDANIPKIGGVVTMWCFAGACFWGTETMIARHGGGTQAFGYIAIATYVAGTLIFLRSLPGVDLFMDSLRLGRRYKQRADIDGKGRLGKIKDAVKAGLIRSDGWMIGQMGRKVLRYAGESSGHYIAPARVGKTLSIIAALVMWIAPKRYPGDDWIGSVVLLDFKGELAATTARIQKEMGRELYFLNPYFMELNKELGRDFPDTCYSGFSDLDVNSPDLLADVAAKMTLLLPDRPGDANARFFLLAGRDRGTMEIMGMLAMGETVSLPLLLERVQLEGDDFIAHIAKLRLSDKFGGSLSRAANKVWGQKLSAPEQVEGGLGELQNVLGIYNAFGSLGSHVSSDDFDPDTITTKPCCIYIMLPTRYTTSHAGWANWVIANLIESVAKSKNNRRVLFVLDEAIRLGVIGNLDRATELYPSAGVTVWCAWQTISAGVMIYGRDGFQKILDNADVIMMRATRGRQDLKMISEMIGQETVENSSRSIDPAKERADYRADRKGRPVKDLNDIRTMSEKEQVLFYKNSPAFICKAINPLTSPKLMSRIDENPYHRKDN